MIILTSLLQYMVQSLNYKRDLARIDLITGKAKAAAWGPKNVPIAGQRKVRLLRRGPKPFDACLLVYVCLLWHDRYESIWAKRTTRMEM